jgi:integrin alpha FG-GAP repeat containing protein 1
MVFTTCSRVSLSTGFGSDCHINIAYNRQLQLCASSTDSGVKNGVQTCRPHDDLCTADPKFKFDLRDDASNDVSVFLINRSDLRSEFLPVIYPLPSV